MSSEENESDSNGMGHTATPITTPKASSSSSHTQLEVDENECLENGNDTSMDNGNIEARLPRHFQDYNDEKDVNISNLSLDDIHINPNLNTTATTTSTKVTPSRMQPILSSSVSTPSSTATTTSTASPNLLNSLISHDGVNNLNPDSEGGHGAELIAAALTASEGGAGLAAAAGSIDAQYKQYAIQQEMEGIKLLRQIFPGESPQELRQLYNEHVMQKANATLASATASTTSNSSSATINRNNLFAAPSPSSRRRSSNKNKDTSISDASCGPKSNLGKRLLQQAMEASDQENEHRVDGMPEIKTTSCEDKNRLKLLEWQEVTLSKDFLRLPPQVAVRRKHYQEPTSPLGSAWRYQLVDELEQRALRQHGVMRYPIRQREQQQNQDTDRAFFLSPPSSRMNNSNDGVVAPVYYTVVIYRDNKVGLGVTLREAGPALRVHALAKNRSKTTSNQIDVDAGVSSEMAKTNRKEGGSIAASPPPGKNNNLQQTIGPSFRAGVRPGDILLGINGTAFRQSKSPNDSLLRHAVNAIRETPDPIVLHLERQSSNDVTLPRPDQVGIDNTPGSTTSPTMLSSHTSIPYDTSESNHIRSPPRIVPQSSLLDEDEMVEGTPGNDPPLPPQPTADSLRISNGGHHSSSMSPGRSKKPLPLPPAIHPFAKALAKRRLILSKQDEERITRTLENFTERTRQWESTSSFRIHAKTFALQSHWDPKDLPPDMAAVLLPFDAYPHFKPELSYGPSTPTLDPTSPMIPREYIEAFYGMDQDDNASWSTEGEEDGSATHPLMLFRRRRQSQAPAKRKFLSYPGAKVRPTQQTDADAVPDIFIPLMGVRKALCSRIVNTFIEETRTAYTIWVYDVESGREWYAPIRYLRDFCDLRAATLPLCPEAIGSLPFPKTSSTWTNVFGGTLASRDESKESERVRQEKCNQLENFLRALCAMIYCHKLHPQVAEIAIHVQSFLGCELGLSGNPHSFGRSHEDEDREHSKLIQNKSASVDPTKSSAKKSRRKRRYCGEDEVPGHDDYQVDVRLMLKRSIQRYTHRLFLLGTMKAIVDQFIDGARARAPQLRELESLESEGRTALKTRAMADMERIQAFLDQLLDLILEGCMGDFESIAARKDFHAIRRFYQPDSASPGGPFDTEIAVVRNSAQFAYWDRLTREAVREQIEIEVYVPLRSVVSRLLVNGWRHEDMEVHFKMEELRKRPQGLFRIPKEKFSPSNWQSVATILKQGVDMNTLPCAKLRAIVEAAREISRLYEAEHEERQRHQQQLQLEDSFRDGSPGGDFEKGWEGGRRSPSREPTNIPAIEDEITKDHLGADDFLPIFIFCVVQAQMERPCALCVLLRTLCDRINRNGEIGYFLASFEAAITHIQEIDLTEDKEEMAELSWLSVPLTDISLNDTMAQ